MTKIYNVYEDESGISQIEMIDQNVDKKMYIPKDLANSDYQAYLRWLNGEPELEPIVRDPAPVEEILIQEVITND